MCDWPAEWLNEHKGDIEDDNIILTSSTWKAWDCQKQTSLRVNKMNWIQMHWIRSKDIFQEKMFIEHCSSWKNPGLLHKGSVFYLHQDNPDWV